MDGDRTNKDNNDNVGAKLDKIEDMLLDPDFISIISGENNIRHCKDLFSEIELLIKQDGVYRDRFNYLSSLLRQKQDDWQMRVFAGV